MKKKNIIFIIILLTIIVLSIFLLLSGGKRTDIYLKDYEVSPDKSKITLKVGLSNSTGYVRKMKRTSGSMNYYLTFYSTFGINSKIGSKDTFTIDIDNNVDEIYFYTGDKGYKKVLELNENNEWIRPDLQEIATDIKNVNVDIYNVSKTGATIIITDTNNPTYTYGSWYKIEKEENDNWTELKTIIKDYGFTSIAYLPDEFNEVKFEINWEWLYGKLPQGSYRIVKELSPSKYIYIPFSIETTS